MKQRPIFSGPYFDPTGIGFALAKPGAVNWRARCISVICCDPIEREAVFINAHGLVLPLEPSPYGLAELIANASSREYGRIEGSGQFALSKSRTQVMEQTGQLKRWVVCRFDDPEGGYANDTASWQGYVENQLEQARRDAKANHDWYRERARVAENGDVTIDGFPWADPDHGSKSVGLEAMEHAHLERRKGELIEQYRREKADDAAITAWLNGSSGTPPLLSLMQSA